MIATLLLSLAPSHTRRSRTRCRPGHPIMRDIIIRIRETCTPRDPKRTPNTAPEHTGGAPAAPTSSGISVAPHPSSSLGAAMATAAAEVGKEEEDRGSSSSSSGGGVGVDQLTALMAGVGGLGLEFGAGGGGGGGSANELMAGLLGDDDVARLQQAIKGGRWKISMYVLSCWDVHSRRYELVKSEAILRRVLLVYICSDTSSKRAALPAPTGREGQELWT